MIKVMSIGNIMSFKDVVMVSLSSQTEKGFCCQLTVGAIAILIEF